MINGIVLIDKPKGLSSNAVVNIVKHELKAKKAGHLGTLDVAGHGLLPVTLNKATKLFDFFLSKDKVYEASFRFGIETDTLDLEGKIVKTDNKIVTEKDILSVIPSFLGKHNQMPPAYSAKKINGQKAYDIARRGGKVNLKPKEIEIYDLNLLKQIGINEFLFKIHCSSGTYIRSLCRDIAQKLSTCGLMSDINRTRCGVFNLSEAYSLEDVKKGNYTLISAEKVFDFEKIDLNENQFEKLLNGVQIETEKRDGDYKLFYENEFVGIGKVENKKLKFALRLV